MPARPAYTILQVKDILIGIPNSSTGFEAARERRGRAKRSVTRPKQGQQGQEQVDDVKVERDGGPDILVIRVTLDDVVRVIDNVATEDERRQRAIDHVRELAHRKEDLNESKDEQHDERSKQERTKEAEILAPPCSPEGVSSEAEDNHRCKNRSLQNDLAASEGTCHAHSEADGHCEDAKQQQVDWVLLAVEVQRTQHCIRKLTSILVTDRLYQLLQFTTQPRPILQQ